MTLRAKLLALFVLLGVAPIVALGAFNYVRSIKAVEDLIAERAASIAGRAAEEIADRHALRQSDLLLFAENAETQRLYRAHAAGNTVQERAAFALADRYLRDAWAVLNPSYRWVEFQDKSGAVLYTLGVDRGAQAAEAETGGSQLLDVIPIDQPIRDVDDGRELGTLLAAVRVQALLPADALTAAFGRAGYSATPLSSLDREPGSVKMSLFSCGRYRNGSPLESSSCDIAGLCYGRLRGRAQRGLRQRLVERREWGGGGFGLRAASRRAVGAGRLFRHRQPDLE